MSVTYSVPALAKRFVGGSGLLQFRTRGSSSEVVDAVRSAVFAALPDGDPDGGPTLEVMDVDPAPGGPVIFISHCDSRALLDGFLSRLASQLGAAGLTGRLLAAPRFEVPSVFAPAMSLVASVEIDHELASSYQDPHTASFVRAWWVDPDRTARVLTPLIEWCLAGPGEVAAMIGMSSMPIARPSVLPTVLHALRTPLSQTSVHLIVLDQDTGAMRQLSTSINGEVVVQHREPGAAWTDLHRPMVELSATIATDLANAFIRVAPSNAHRLYQAFEYPSPQIRLGSNLYALAHLQAEYLIDVHGYQVVTTQHLHRCGQLDPARWSVDTIAADRHTITHHDLAAWLDVDHTPYSTSDYANARPATPPDPVLAQAREDFRDVLLTPEVWSANPSPALSTEGMRYYLCRFGWRESSDGRLHEDGEFRRADGTWTSDKRLGQSWPPDRLDELRNLIAELLESADPGDRDTYGQPMALLLAPEPSATA